MVYRVNYTAGAVNLNSEIGFLLQWNTGGDKSLLVYY